MTFYGESVALDWANNLTGTGAGSSGDELRYHFDGTSTTVAPGDEFIAGAYMFGGGVSGLTDTDEVACAWAVEVGPATDGSLSFAAGLDPDFALADPGLATTGLGTHALSGQSTLVLPVTLQTAAQILAHTEEQILRVQGVSGTVELLQVKLRVWPASGPSGAWTSGSGYSEPRTGMRLWSARADGNVPDGAHFGAGQAAADDAQQRARDLLPAYEGTLALYTESADPFSSDVFVTVTGPFTDGTFTARAQFGERNAYLLADVEGLNPSPPSGSGYDPREVPDEAQSYVRGVGGGAPSASFGGWAGSFTVTCDNTNTTEPGFYGVTDLPSRPPVTPDGSSYRIPWHSYAGDAVNGISGGSSLTVPLSGGPYLALTPTTVGRLGPFAVVPADSIIQDVTFSAIDPTFTVAFGDFEWWDPSLPWVDRQPRFFVKDYEGAWRPVGFGKPASDTSRFHVWTPVGWYVECLDGETYTNAHPLKVKLYDGTWDTVAHMRPL